MARSLFDWGSADGDKYLGVGTNLKFYVESGGTVSDVTPIRATTSAGDVTFAATNGSSTLVVTDTAHGAVEGDFVTYSGAASLGGNVTAAVLNQEYQIGVIVNANSYNITAKDTAGADSHSQLQRLWQWWRLYGRRISDQHRHQLLCR